MSTRNHRAQSTTDGQVMSVCFLQLMQHADIQDEIASFLNASEIKALMKLRAGLFTSLPQIAIKAKMRKCKKFRAQWEFLNSLSQGIGFS